MVQPSDRAAADISAFGEVPERLPAVRSAFPRDDAWPNYLFGQARTDLRAALGHVGHVSDEHPGAGRLQRGEQFFQVDAVALERDPGVEVVHSQPDCHHVGLSGNGNG